MDFLDKLSSLMEERNVTKSELAKGSGIPYTTIDSFYKKGFENTKLSTLCKLSEYFGVSLDYLCRDTVTAKKSPAADESETGDEPVTQDNSDDFFIDSFYTMFVKAGYVKNGEHLTNRQRMAVAGMINMIRAVFTVRDEDIAI